MIWLAALWLSFFSCRFIYCIPYIDYDLILREQDELLRVQKNKLVTSLWNLHINITGHNEKIYTQCTNDYDKFKKKQYETIREYMSEEHNKFMTIRQRRQFEKLAFLGFSILGQEDGEELTNSITTMENIYASAKVMVNGENLTIEPGLSKIMAESKDERLLREIWVKWREETGKKIKSHFQEYRDLGNKAATVLGYKTMDDIWMVEWESATIKKDAERLMDNLMDLYKKIHAYVRYHLKKVYKKAMPSDGTIPAHLLGNMWGLAWTPLLTLIPSMKFYPEISSIDESVNKKFKNWTIRQMYELAEEFFYSLGMKNMTQKFWKNSVFEKRKGVEMVCHASAWDFYEQGDFRIKQCTGKTLEDLLNIHHEMGHIQYYMNYEHQPVVFRDGANPGFHEAIGDLIALSVLRPQHLAKIGLLEQKEIENLEAVNLNYQLWMALDKIVFLPYAFIVDKWRWNVFAEKKLNNHMNRHWWELRLKYQGISPPVQRSEEDFDPGCKYHVAANVEYIRYFVSHIVQFQIYKKLCKHVSDLEKLYLCDFYENKYAGKDLINIMKKGSSESWEEILEDYTGSPKMSLNALYEYFSPLNKTLSNFLKKHKIKVGWKVNIEPYFYENPLKDSSWSVYNSAFIVLISSLVYISFILVF